jgi:Family of unknown function (DUF6082)
MRTSVRKAARVILVASLSLLGLGIILISPVGLKLISLVRGVNWVELGNVGQTYGAISAVISGVALGGVALSLFLQSRDFNLSRTQAMRNYHSDLVRFSIENPSFISSWGFIPPRDSDMEEMRRIGFLNMIVNFWKDGYETRAFDDDEIRLNFSQMFQGEAGRSYWMSSRLAWLEVATGQRDRRFVKIAEDEYRKAVDSGPATVPADLTSYLASAGARSLHQRLSSRWETQLLAGFTLGILTARVFFRRR